MITLATLLALALTLLTFGLFRACKALTLHSQRPFAVTRQMPGHARPAAPLRPDIVALRGQLRSRTLREPAVVWPATDFADTEVADLDSTINSPIVESNQAAGAVTWTPLDRREDVRLILKF